jgi:hydrogenase maturation protease
VATEVLILGIGNVLMGDEGVGVHVVRELEKRPLPVHVICCDGGTGSFLLLEPMQSAKRVILIDATADGETPGTIRRLQPRFSRDYPRTLTAHDIGLKDLLDAFHLMGEAVEVTLFTVSIPPFQDLGMELSPAIASSVPRVVESILREITPGAVDVQSPLTKCAPEELCTN